MVEHKIVLVINYCIWNHRLFNIHGHLELMVLFHKMQFQSVYSSKHFSTQMTFCVSSVRTVVVLQRPTVSELLATSFTSELWRLQWGSKLWSTFNLWPENIFRCPGHNYRGKKHAEVNNFKNCNLNYQLEKISSNWIFKKQGANVWPALAWLRFRVKWWALENTAAVP